jgi:hypothetical protein
MLILEFGTLLVPEEAIRAWNRDHDKSTNTTARFFSQYLFPSHPTVFVDEVDPILEDFQTEGVIPSSDV